jgi:transcription-repair coupling factor (superfamily II helicase)
MERVKLTPAQVEALEKWKGMANRKQILIAFTGEGKQYGWLDELECLKSLSFEEMALALCDWYEVEEPFKVGDWVKYQTFGGVYVYGKIEKINEFSSAEAQWSDGKGGGIPLYGLMRMTDEEIAAEKERRKWSAIGRKVGEYKRNDIICHKQHGFGIYVGDNKMAQFSEGGYRGLFTIDLQDLELIVPVEHRFDMKGDE